MVQVYNKAVRDNVPDIIRSQGQKCGVIALSNEQFLLALENKLTEEVYEYNEDKSVEELVDILEVILRIAELKGVSNEKLEAIRKDKRLTRGGFEKNLFLLES